MNHEARVRFERWLDAAAKKAVDGLLRDGDPIEGRVRLRDLLRRVAAKAAQKPDLFDPAQEQ